VTVALKARREPAVESERHPGRLSHDPGLTALLLRFPGNSRVGQVDAALRSLGRATAEAHLLVCELAVEVADKEYWRRIGRPGGGEYTDVVDYLRDVLGLDRLKRSAVYQRIRLGRAVLAVDPGLREWLRAHLVAVGMSKAIALAPVIRSNPAMQSVEHWLKEAGRLDANKLRRVVAKATDAQPRGVPRVEVCPTCKRPWRKRAAAAAASSRE
jgi:hypothetical protein